ncbi:Nicotinate phosphoribosyltransferase 1 [Diplonema papillatum]|nr:Nicotinate phosphoribosyltransferase 1 [Diplonema papillatum]
MYQLTTAQGYWKLHRQDEEAVFHLYFRKTPFHGSYVMSAGLDTTLEYLECSGLFRRRIATICGR